MALTEKLELLLTADPTQGISALKQFSAEAEKTSKSSTASLQKIGTTALKLGAGGLAAGTFLTQMASDSIEASNQLKAAIENVGQSQSDYTERIDDTSDAMTRFGITDKEVTGALTKLVLAYNDTGEALDQIQLSADLAARKQISLADAAGLVARAHGGSTKLFKEFGIQVKENTDGTKDLDGALTQLAAKLSGQAAAGAESWGGRLQELRANVENVVSEFAENWGPTIEVVSAGMTVFGGVITGVTTVMGKVRAAHAAHTAAAQASAAAAAEAAAAEAALTINSSAAVASLYAEAGAANTAAAALTRVGTAALYALPIIGAFVAVNWKDFMGHGEGPDKAEKALAGIATRVRDIRNEDLATWIDGAIIELDGLGDTGTRAERGLKIFNETLKSSPQEARRVAAALADIGIVIPDVELKIAAAADAQREAAGRAKDWTEATVTAEESLKALGKAAEGAMKLTDDLSSAMGRSYDAMLEPTKLASTYEAALDDLAEQFFVSTGDIASANRDFESAGLKVKDAVSGVADAQEKLDKMRKDGKSSSREIADQERAVAEAYLGVQDAQVAAADAESELGDARKEGNFTLDLSTEAGRKNVDAALKMGDAIKDLILRRFDETHSQQAAIDSGKLYVEGLKQQLRQAGLTEDEIQGLIDTMHLTPEEIDTTFSNNAVEQQLVIGKYLQMLKDIPPNVQTEIEALINQGQYDAAAMRLAALAAPRTALIDARVIGGVEVMRVGLSLLSPAELAELGLTPADVAGRQAGGPGHPGSTYFIEPGTKGEYFTPNQAGYFTPVDKMGGKGGYTVNIGQIVTSDPQDAGEQVARRLRIEAVLAGP